MWSLIEEFQTEYPFHSPKATSGIVVSLETNLKLFDGFLALVEEKRIRMALDIALEPEDHANILTIFAFSPQLLSSLASRGIELQVSLDGK